MAAAGNELDDFVGRLQALREAQGSPSFGDIALGVSRVRRERGVAPESARVGRTTVYDAFRMGRRRLDAALVADIVRALTADEVQADRWAMECRRAQVETPVVVVPAVTEPARPEPTASLAPRVIALVVVLSVMGNVGGRALVDLMGLPIYLDMVGTAFSAIVLGPWWGVLVGLTTNTAGAAVSGPESLWFTGVNVAGALLWGYGARRWRMGRSVPRFFVLNLLVATVCTAIAVPVLLLVYGGGLGHAQDAIAARFLGVSHSLWLSVLVSNLLTSLVDKLFTGFVAMSLVEALGARVRAGLPVDWMIGSPPDDEAAVVRACSGSVQPL